MTASKSNCKLPGHPGAWIAGGIAVALLLFASGLAPLATVQAQTEADPPAAPRAVPVKPGGAKDKPAIARPVQIPATPIPPPPTARIVAKPVDPKVIDDPKVKEAREDLIAYADLLFSREKWGLAAAQYQIFLKEHPTSPNVPSAWFRLGECYLAADQDDDAMASFSYLVKRFKKGDFVGAAAYRIATAKFTAGDHESALEFFTIAAGEAPAAELQLQASYYGARCLELLKRNEEAIAAYRKVLAASPADSGEKSDPESAPDAAPDADADAKPDGDKQPAINPFAERASLSIARLLNQDKDTQAAYEQYLSLSKTAKIPAVKQESLARAGLLAAQLGKAEESNRLLDAVLNVKDGDDEAAAEWKGTAQVALIFNLYAAEQYDRVVGVYNRGITATPDDIRPKMLIMVANSMRQIDDLKSAANVYRIIEQNYREDAIAAEAIFRKLQCLDQIGDLDLVNEIDRFVASQKKYDADSPFVDLALLMKGEWHFQRNNWKPAAAAYAAVRVKSIPEKYHPARLYKLGWAETESDEVAAGIGHLTEFIKRFPDDPFVPSALTKRAVSQLALDNHQDALADFKLIAEKYPDSEQSEFVLEQIAFIYNVQRDVPGMVAAYRQLLEKFPETAGAAEAWYYIGAGHYDQKQYAEAIEPLLTARKLDKEAFTTRATEVLILCYFRLKDVAGLSREADLALNTKPPISVPIPVLNYLGEALFQKADYKSSERFFAAASTPARPGETPSAVWDYLGRARHQIGLYGGAVIAFDYYLGIVQSPRDRAEGYLNKSRSLLASKDYQAADEAAQEALKLAHQGKLNARGRLMRGDVALARGDADAAAREYFITSQIFVGDPEITPQAMAKAARAYRAGGDTAKADEIDAQLKQSYPDYSLPAEG